MYLYYADPVLLAAAVIPAVVLMVIVYKKDRLEKEPIGLLLALLLMGVFATGLALLTERLGSALLPGIAREGTVLYNVLMYFVVVAASEEGFKYLLLKLRTWRNPNFNCQFDGVVYAVFVSLGFALWENISYVLSYGLTTAILRAVTSVPVHGCLGVFMGLWFGAAKRYANAGMEQMSRACRRRAFFMPLLLHGAFDYIVSVDMNYGALIFIVFIIGMFIAAYSRMRKAAQADNYID